MDSTQQGNAIAANGPPRENGHAVPPVDPRGNSVWEEIFARVSAKLACRRWPSSTYRLQFNVDFTFRDAAQIVPYLAALGISDCYSSPFLQARPGSRHGYDVVNHSRLNPELGTSDDFQEFVAALQQAEMGHLLDLVPNHMSASADDNPWWLDVLENGPSSPYASFFDIDWDPLKPDLASKVLLPVLGDQFGRVLEDGQLALCFSGDGFWLDYFQKRFPLSPNSYATILERNVGQLREALGESDQGLLEYLSILTAIQNLPPLTETDPVKAADRQRETIVVKRRLQELTTRSGRIRDFIEANVRELNGHSGDPRSFDALDSLLSQQAYRLADWRVGADEINYRRFFDVNDLAALRMEEPAVFEQTHRFVFELLAQRKLTGVRIDHPDGLYDPPAYLRNLQSTRFLQMAAELWEAEPFAREFPDVAWETVAAELQALWEARCTTPQAPAAQPLFVVVEKILEEGENLPRDWFVQGTVGYEFLNALNGVFVNPAAEKAFSAMYERFTEQTESFRDLVYRSKHLIERMVLSSEVMVLSHQLDRISECNRWTRDFTLSSLIRALQEVIAGFTIYRTYISEGHLLERDRQFVEQAVARAKRRNPTMTPTVFDFIRDILLLRYRDNSDEAEREAQRRFVGKFQQLTGPIMAKAVEDTSFYIYHRLVSLNEVGGEADRFGTSLAEFHQLNLRRAAQSPHGLSPTTTHDTKRSEDTRARIDVLSEVPKPWREAVVRWRRFNKELKTHFDGELAPSLNDEYLLYQTLVGCWPQADFEPADFLARMQEYMLKAIREAKVETSWINPNAAYEQATTAFVAAILAPERKSKFKQDLAAFALALSEHGMANSLAQLLLKIASPGVPDFFQGTELWALTLVDPDNRRPVDYVQRAARWQALERRLPQWGEPIAQQFLDELIETRAAGEIKMYVMQRALSARRAEPRLFSDGDYIHVEAHGTYGEHVVAFARRHGKKVALAVAPRWTVRVAGWGKSFPLRAAWGDTRLVLPAEFAARSWTDVFTGAHFARTAGPASASSGAPDGTTPPVLPLADLFGQFPVALLLSDG